VRDGDRFDLDENRPKSIGKVRGYTGPFGVFVRSYAYIRMYGRVARDVRAAVLNANYLAARLKGAYELPFERLCMHEFVLSARTMKREHGVTALDVAKRLMDFGFHPPTIYFPLVVPEALMIEPTETEAKETLDAFVDAMLAIAHEAEDDPDVVRGAPHSRIVGRLDEVRAVRELVVRHRFQDAVPASASGIARDRGRRQRRAPQGDSRRLGELHAPPLRPHARHALRRRPVRCRRVLRPGRSCAPEAERPGAAHEHDAARRGCARGGETRAVVEAYETMLDRITPRAAHQRRPEADTPRAVAERGSSRTTTSPGSRGTRPAVTTSSAWTWRSRATSMRRSTSTGDFATRASTLSASCSRRTSSARARSRSAPAPQAKPPTVQGRVPRGADVAYPEKADVDAAFTRLMERAMRRRDSSASRRDERLIEHAIAFARREGIPGDRFQFQMLYGVRPQLQLQLVKRGYPVLVATPYGPDWYRYLMRRLAERPANVGFLLRNLVRG
jgi:hypothetical protein